MRATLPATIEIIQDLAATTAKIIAAPVQIQQIVMNLCANAFSAMKDKGGQLTIRLREQSGGQLNRVEEADSLWAVWWLKIPARAWTMKSCKAFSPLLHHQATREGTAWAERGPRIVQELAARSRCGPSRARHRVHGAVAGRRSQRPWGIAQLRRAAARRQRTHSGGG